MSHLENPSPLLMLALEIAREAHEGQFYGEEPYFDKHIMSVATRVDEADLSEDHVIVAVLHDLIEDTDWTYNDLYDHGFPTEVVNGVNAVTRRKGQESYSEFIARASRDPIGRDVKYHDLLENRSNPGKPELNERYDTAIAQLADS